MKKRFLKLVILTITMLTCILGLVACNKNANDTKYTIIWKNYDGTILEIDSDVAYGTTPSYDGATPTKAGDTQYSYTFDGWSPTLTKVTSNQTYTAKFLEITKKYTITWKNYDGTILEIDSDVAYGTTPSYDGATPTKAGDTQYSYTFDGWSPTLTKVTSNQTYTAKFATSINFSKIEISTSFLQMNVGDSYTFLYNYWPTNAKGNVELKTKNPEIISIEEHGKVTAIGIGVAIVYAESNNGLTSECTIVCSKLNALKTPITINNWSNPAYFITETAELTEINFRFEQSTSKSLVCIQYNIMALKTYCKYSGSYAIKINYKLYNSKGVVVDSGTITSPKFNTGETVNITGKIYVGCALDGDEYTIELSDVAW